MVGWLQKWFWWAGAGGGQIPPNRVVFDGTVVTRRVFSEVSETMAFPDIHKEDVGTELVVEFVDEDGDVIDISTATTKQILLRRPHGPVVTKSGTFDTDGTDGLLKYTTEKDAGPPVAYDLDRAGPWQIQGYVVIGSVEWHTKIHTFEVAGNLN